MSLFFNNFFSLNSFSLFISIYGESPTISTPFIPKKLFILYINLEKKLDLSASIFVTISVVAIGVFDSRPSSCVSSY